METIRLTSEELLDALVFGSKTEKKKDILKTRTLETRIKDQSMVKGHGRQPADVFTGTVDQVGKNSIKGTLYI